jgi:hypothetical protein
MSEIVHDYFLEISMAIGLIVWSIRLEGKVKQVEKIADMHDEEIKALDIKLNTFDSKLLTKLSEIAERLSYIEGAIKGSQNERD